MQCLGEVGLKNGEKYPERDQGRGGHGKRGGGAFGPVGYCVCAACGERVQHQKAVKCTTLKCPECGKTMIREELLKNTKKSAVEAGNNNCNPDGE